jgi:hypothetical protein
MGTSRRAFFLTTLKTGAVLMLLGLAACSDERPAMPPDAPGITRPEEYFFGSATRNRDWQATKRVLDQLERRFGEKSMDILMRNLDAAASPQAVKAHYNEQLVKKLGWTEMQLASFGPEKAWAFAFISPNGDWVFAVEALDASESEGAMVPLNILTNLDGDGTSKTH